MRIFVLLILATACSAMPAAIEESIPTKPASGWDRNALFPNYTIYNGQSLNVPIYRMFRARTQWTQTHNQFRTLYPNFNINLLSFNQFASPNQFTWEERLMFSDAMNLLAYAINSSRFDEEMARFRFFNNERTKEISSKDVVAELREAAFNIVISKRTLGDSVLAEATVGGNYIWFRNDVNYQEYNVVFLAMILGHELTHNIGYRHSSNIPYGVHDPIVQTIYAATEEDATKYSSVTPYQEQEYIDRVRYNTASYTLKSDEYDIEKDDYDAFSKYLDSHGLDMLDRHMDLHGDNHQH